MVYVLADAPLAHLLHRRPRALSLPTGHAPIASGGSNSCRVGYLPPTGSTCPFHGARFLRASTAPSLTRRAMLFIKVNRVWKLFVRLQKSLLEATIPHLWGSRTFHRNLLRGTWPTELQNTEACPTERCQRCLREFRTS